MCDRIPDRGRHGFAHCLVDDIFAEPTYAAVVDAQLPIDDVLKQIGRIASL